MVIRLLTKHVAADKLFDVTGDLEWHWMRQLLIRRWRASRADYAKPRALTVLNEYLI